MPDGPPKPSPAQAGMIDELNANVIGWDEGGESPAVIVQKPDGETVMLTVDGEVKPVVGVEKPEVIDGTSQEVDVEAEADEFKPPEIALAVDASDPADVFRAMDRADEVQILDELMGRAITALVYDFGEGKDRKVDLSVAGVNETIRLMNERGGTRIGIAPTPPLVNHIEKPTGKDGSLEAYYEVMVYAVDQRNGSGRWGVAIEPEEMRLKGGGRKWDKFALTKALNKAQRNAMRAHIPEDFRQQVIALALDSGQTEKLKLLGGGNVAELPPPIQGADADRVRGEISEVYEKLKAFSRTVMPPARYNAFFTQANTVSVKRLEEFRDHLANLVEEEEVKANGGAETP